MITVYSALNCGACDDIISDIMLLIRDNKLKHLLTVHRNKVKSSCCAVYDNPDTPDPIFDETGKSAEPVVFTHIENMAKTDVSISRVPAISIKAADEIVIVTGGSILEAIDKYIKDGDLGLTDFINSNQESD